MRNFNFDLPRMLCEATVERAMRDIQRDTKRSLRNLVDLGLNFTSGRYSHSILEMVQTMLSDEQSAYFEAVQMAIQNVDAETLKTFLINVGLEGCTRGAKKIRELEERENFNIPWALTICAGREGVGLSDCLRLVEEGMALGGYVYLLLDTGLDGLFLAQLATAYPKCAFVLLTGALCADESEMAHLQELHNVMYFIDADMPEKEESLRNLQAERCLYGLYRWYNQENAAAVISDAALDSYRDDNPISLCLIPREETPQAVRRAVSTRISGVRKSLLYPYCALEYSIDLLAVDVAVSGDGCAVAVCPNGQIHTVRKGTLSGEEFSIYHHALAEILRRATPKLQA